MIVEILKLNFNQVIKYIHPVLSLTLHFILSFSILLLFYVYFHLIYSHFNLKNVKKTLFLEHFVHLSSSF
jgi:hypothetical protein